MVRGAVMGIGGFTRNFGTGCPALPASAAMISGGWPGVKIGTSIENSTVSIQNTESIFTALAFGLLLAGSPSRNAMLSVPPPKRGATAAVATSMTVVDVMVCDAMWLRSRVLGSSIIACVIVPAATKDVRSCGILGVSLLEAFWLGNGTFEGGWPILNGVVSLGPMTGGPLIVEKVPWASIVVPWGIDAMRQTVRCRTWGSVVFRLHTQSPGSKRKPPAWMAPVIS